MQSCGMAPLGNLGKKFEHTNRQNLGEDLFFGLHLILGRKTVWILRGEIFRLVFIILKFLAPLPLSKILRMLLCGVKILCLFKKGRLRWCIIFSNIFEKQFKIDMGLKLFGLSFSLFL